MSREKFGIENALSMVIVDDGICVEVTSMEWTDGYIMDTGLVACD